MIVSLIAAVAKNGVIGIKGDLPWSLPNDMKFFSKTTRGHHVLMGRKNYDSIPDKFRPLPGRPNLVVTRGGLGFAEGAYGFASILDAIDFAKANGETELFVIGGGEIYAQTMDIADRVYLTEIEASIDGDTVFPDFKRENWTKELLLEQSKDDVHNFAFKTYCYLRKH
jgi:dihydrofolate reductase